MVSILVSRLILLLLPPLLAHADPLRPGPTQPKPSTLFVLCCSVFSTRLRVETTISREKKPIWLKRGETIKGGRGCYSPLSPDCGHFFKKFNLLTSWPFFFSGLVSSLRTGLWTLDLDWTCVLHIRSIPRRMRSLGTACLSGLFSHITDGLG